MTRNLALSFRYAAPEQLRGSPRHRLAINTSWLCCYFELLTGVGPFSGEDTMEFAVARAVSRPDAHLPSNVATEEAAGKKQMTVRELRGRLRGDLDAILLKGLDPAPPSRYRSVGELASDIERARSHRSVLARRRTRTYRVRRFLRRN